jgi:hypothetical protein
MNEIRVWSTGGRILEQWWKDTERESPAYSQDICQPKTHTDWPGIEPNPYRGEAGD